MTEKKIIWESYHISESSEQKDPREEMLRGFDPEDLDEEDGALFNEISEAPTVLDTPIGLVMKDNSMNPLRRIEHRICHTNFTITKKIAVITNFIEGVETLAVISRYQMIVGFGRLFNASAVRKTIEETLINIDDYSENLYQRQLLIIEEEAECQ